MRYQYTLLCLLAAAGIIIGFAWRETPPPPTPPPPPPPVEAITFGVVPQFGVKHFAEAWEPLIRRLEVSSGINISLIPTPSIPAFEEGFSRGDFDFAYMNPYHYLCAKRDQGYVPLIRDQSKQLKGILVVKADSNIKSVEDLDGKRIAFPAPNALGASLYMRALLSRTHDIDFTPLYVNSHDSVYLNVTTDEVVAGGGVKRTLLSQAPETQSSLRVIYETPGVAPHPITYHPRVKADTVEKIRNAWMSFAKSPDGRILLESVPMADPGVAEDKDYQPLAKLELDEFYVAPTHEEESQ